MLLSLKPIYVRPTLVLAAVPLVTHHKRRALVHAAQHCTSSLATMHQLQAANVGLTPGLSPLGWDWTSPLLS